MDIFKLIFHHDLLLEQLSGSTDARNKTKPEMSLEDFMKPIPTYTKYYFSGTRLEENMFGLTTLENKNKVYTAIQQALAEQKLWSTASSEPVTLTDVRYAAARLWVDAIIRPEETRDRISAALSVADHNPEVPPFNTGVIQT